MDHDTPTRLPRVKIDARLTSVIRYWDELRGDRLAAARLDIQPTALSRHLSRISILERPRSGSIRMRLVGASVSSRLGLELRGMPFRSMFEMDYREQALLAAEIAISTPAISVISLGTADTGPLVEGQMAIMPLFDARGALTRALTVYSQRPATTALPATNVGRFTITDCWQIDIPEEGPILSSLGQPKATQRPIARKMQHGAAVGAASEPMRDPALARMQVPPQPEGRPVFRVIKGGLA